MKNTEFLMVSIYSDSESMRSDEEKKASDELEEEDREVLALEDDDDDISKKHGVGDTKELEADQNDSFEDSHQNVNAVASFVPDFFQQMIAYSMQAMTQPNLQKEASTFSDLARRQPQHPTFGTGTGNFMLRPSVLNAPGGKRTTTKGPAMTKDNNSTPPKRNRRN